MYTTELKEDWENQKAKLIQRLTNLSNNDLLFLEAKKEEIIEKIGIYLNQKNKNKLKASNKK